MRHILFWVITVPVLIILVTFTVMNRQDIALDLWPLPWETPIPAYGLIFGCLLVGFAFGVFVMWRHGSTGRRHRRDLHRQVNLQANELENLRRQAATPTTKVVARLDPNALVPPAI
jgi:uncharacterized integral membrane protein